MRVYSRHSHKSKRFVFHDGGDNNLPPSGGSANFVAGVFGVFGRNSKYSPSSNASVNSSRYSRKSDGYTYASSAGNSDERGREDGAFPSFVSVSRTTSGTVPSHQQHMPMLGKSFEESLPSLAATTASDWDDTTLEKDESLVDDSIKECQKLSARAAILTSNQSSPRNNIIESTIDVKTPTPQKEKCSWAGTGFDGDSVSLCVSMDSSVGCSPITPGDKAVDVSILSARKLNPSSPRPDTICFGKYGSPISRYGDSPAMERKLFDVDERQSSVEVQPAERKSHDEERSSINNTQIEALRSLARAASHQRTLAESLKKKVQTQEKIITTQKDLCARLVDKKRNNDLLQIKMKKEINSLNSAKTELQLKLNQSDLSNDELSATVRRMSDRIRQLEVETAEKSLAMNRLKEERGTASSETAKSETALLTASVLEKLTNELKECRADAERREAEDKAIIKRLRAEMSSMAASHARVEELSRSKIEILFGMKTALEEQVRLLVEGDQEE